MLDKNSSNVADESDPDHWGTNVTKDRSSCRIGAPTEFFYILS